MAVLTLSAWGHHAHGNYAAEMVDMEGIVTELYLLNPHSWLYFEVTKADGQRQLWGLEAASKGQLGANGVSHEYIKPGDRVKVRCHPLTDGGPGCLAGFVRKMSDGSVKDWDLSITEYVPEDF